MIQDKGVFCSRAKLTSAMPNEIKDFFILLTWIQSIAAEVHVSAGLKSQCHVSVRKWLYRNTALVSAVSVIINKIL